MSHPLPIDNGGVHMARKSWYSLKALAGDTLEISIHDEIGLWGVNAKDFLADLKASGNPSTIRLSIQSPGGDVMDAYAIANTLRSHSARVVAVIEGCAASAASYIACAADEIEMAENSWLMFHQPWTIAMGDSEEMRDTADFLDRHGKMLMKLCAAKAGMQQEELEALIAAAPGKELWLDGLQAEEMGFADTITARIELAALTIDTRRFSNMPQSLSPISAEAEAAPTVEPSTEAAPVEDTATATESTESTDEVVEAEAPVTSEDTAQVEEPVQDAPRGGVLRAMIDRLTGRTEQAPVEDHSDLRAQVSALTTERDALLARVQEMAPLAALVDELETQLTEAQGSRAREIADAIAQTGFDAVESELPAASATAGPNLLEQFEQAPPEERTRLFKAHQAEIKRLGLSH